MMKVKSERNEYGWIYYAEVDRINETYKTFHSKDDIDGYEEVSGYLAMMIVNMGVNLGYKKVA